AVESAHVERSLHFYRPPVAAIEHFSSSIHDSGIRGLRITQRPHQTGQGKVCVIPRPQCDGPRVEQPHSWHLWHGELSSAGLAPAPGRRPPQPGCFGLGAIAATKILFQLIKFQVYGQADNSSMTIVCCGAVLDCGNLIKTTRLAVPSPARALTDKVEPRRS